MSRRSLIRAGAVGLAAGVAATTFRPLPARSAPGSQFLGADKDYFEAIQSVVNGLSGVRMYGSKPIQNTDGSYTSDVRSTWPQPIPNGSTTPIPDPGPMVYSIYPVPSEVLDGSLYGTLTGLIGTAPPNSYLNCWHEALSLDTYDQYGFITSDNMYQLHARLNTYVKNSPNSANVTYGSIFGGWWVSGVPPLATLLQSVPPNLGFYGLDLYASGTDSDSCSSGIADGMAHLEDFINQVASKDTNAEYPKIMIPECNYAPDHSLLGDPGNPNCSGDRTLRGQWFEAVCSRMHTYGANAIGTLTFWGGGSLSGPWDTSAPWYSSTVNDMNYCINTILT